MTDKTIRMPAQLLADWLAALRSGEFSQGSGSMLDSGGNHCCLGVLQAVRGEVEPHESEHCGYAAIPSEEWMRAHGVEFKVFDDLPGIVKSNYSGNPVDPVTRRTFADLNDSGVPFAVLADAIEACAEGY
jgi:hypothetical protein